MKILAGYLLTVNLVALFTMAGDKRRAVAHRRRIRERVLFLLALMGGSIGILSGMYLFRHKTAKAKFVFGIPCILCLQLVLFLIFHSWYQKHINSPSGVVRSALSSIERMDETALQNFLTYQYMISEDNLLPEDQDTARQAVLAFYHDFLFSIQNETISGDRAQVTALITNLDAPALAHDLALELTRRRIDLSSPSENDLSADDFFQILNDTLKNNQYPDIETTAVFSLTKTGSEWTIQQDDALQNELTSGLTDALKDPYLLVPEEVLPIYMEAFDSLNAQEWLSYLNTEDIFSTFSPTYSKELDSFFLEKAVDYFEWSIDEINTEQDHAQAVLSITSIDLPYIMEDFRDSLMKYASTTDSITSDSVELSDASAGYLLEAMKENARPHVTKASVTMKNNGQGWQLTVDDELTNAFLGDMRTALKVLRGE